jgi:lipid-binding SYLF domain-containing protein
VNFLKPGFTSYFKLGVPAFVLTTLLLGCTTLSPEEQQAKRIELNGMCDKTVATLLETQPQLQEVFDNSVGYVVLDMTVTKIPVFGAGGGLGVVVDKRTGTRSYTKVSRFEVGGGVGAQKYKVIIVFTDAKLLDQIVAGAWHYKAGAEVNTGKASTENVAKKTQTGYQTFRLLEGGGVATVTLRVAHAKPYLNE